MCDYISSWQESWFDGCFDMLSSDSWFIRGNTGHENAMSCVDDDCGKSFIIFVRYKNAYHIEETKTVLVKEDCSWSVYDDLCKSFLILFSYKNCV